MSDLSSLLQEAQHTSLLHRTRRHFLRDCSSGLGALWLAGNGSAFGGPASHAPGQPLSPEPSHQPPRAKRVIYLHMAGSPSQLELFDHKPELAKHDGKDCPAEFMEDNRFAFISGVPNLLGPCFKFQQHGASGAWVSERLPHFAKRVDDVCFVKSMNTDQFNHAPAQLLLHTGNSNMGNPSMGSWVTYGLGTENQNLPGFIVLVSGGKVPSSGKSVWGSGFLPSVYQGVQCRSKGDPVLYLSNPKGISRSLRRRTLDTINAINKETHEEVGDPETLTRISQYEMAFRMQVHASQAFDLKDEPEHVHKLYGTAPGRESFANNCLLARRLAERGVRYINLFHWGWDSHGAGANESLHHGFVDRCRETDQAMSALLFDLKQRGLLEDTLIVWSGEFGRTPMQENRNGAKMSHKGRDHNPNAFTIWMAGGGVRPGLTYGATDELGYRAIESPVTPRDLQATILDRLGMRHRDLTFHFQGLDQTLPGVTKPSRVIRDLVL